LDVVVPPFSASDPTTSSAAHSKVPAFCDQTSDLSGTSAKPPIDDNTIEDLEITASNGGKQIVRLEQRNSPGSSFEQRLVSFLPPDIQTQVRASSDVRGWVIQAIQNGQVDRLNEQLIACLQHLKDEMGRNNGLVSDVKELTLKNNGLASDVKELTLKDNGLVSDVKELTLKDNGLVSDVKELTLKDNEMASRNNEMALKNNELVTDVKDLTIKNTELSTNIIKMQEAFDAKQEEVKQLQVQALSQLALLQNRVSALVT
jgi:outer membrane murein-binding lipoprotein Lpp